MASLGVDPASGAAPDENPVEAIQSILLAKDLERFRATLEKALAPQAAYLTEAEYAIYRRGKKLRPMLMMLAARMLIGPDAALPDKVVQGAVSLEMLHAATLIHDDIVDRALTRRGLASVNAARGIETAVIVGDMQFVQAVRGFVDAITVQKDMGLIRLVLSTAFRICCGELDELNTDPTWDTQILHARYLETIDRKTAVLFGLACEAGVVLAGGKEADARRAGIFGRRLGTAFQMMDDLFDFVHDQEISGKSIGMDLARRRVSLPLIYAIEELGPSHPVTRIMKGAATSESELAEGIRAVRISAAFQRAYTEARAKALEALLYLEPFPHNRYRSALARVTHHVVDRGF